MSEFHRAVKNGWKSENAPRVWGYYDPRDPTSRDATVGGVSGRWVEDPNSWNGTLVFVPGAFL